MLLDNEGALGELSEKNEFNEMGGDNEKLTYDKNPNEGRIRIHSPLSIEVEREVHALNTIDDSF